MKPIGCREGEVAFTMADAVDNMIHVIVNALFGKKAEMLAGQKGANGLLLDNLLTGDSSNPFHPWRSSISRKMA